MDTSAMTQQPSTEYLEFQEALAGEYSLQRELGRGGMGIVYLARDVQLDRDVAIKVLPSPLALTHESRERFIREARTAAGLSHPHIVPIHRVGEAGGFVFFVMSYVEGETLGERLRARGPLPPAEATRVLREVAWALAYAHGRGIVHRDIKPDNILLEAATGRALVTDFGIAHGGAHSIAATDPRIIMGTAHFMSPEQAANEAIDGRSDIYALGVVGYLAVSGTLPFDAPSLPALIVRQATEAPASILRAAPGLPASLASTIDRCLLRDREGRFPDGEAMAAALAPTPDRHPALPSTLRAWLVARNPLLLPYLGWSGAMSVLTLGNIYAWITGNPGSGPEDAALLITATSLPLFPILGFHLNHARRQFRAGHTLADLRTALDVARRERAETESVAVVREGGEARVHQALRIATIASAGWLATTMGRVIIGSITEQQLGAFFIFVPILTTMLLGATSNALDVQFIPHTIRNWWQTGIRDKLWNSRAGEFLARRLGAPEQSTAVGAAVFRPTEAALGVAAGELFKALPQAFRKQLADLPATVAALEARAAEARADLDVISALAPAETDGADVLSARRDGARKRLGESVAALEGLRIDLLRLHAGAGNDMAPLTTLIDAARRLGDDASRLADAQREVEAALVRPASGARRIETPV
ncbi:MAG: serine/threonine protein kinase [Phycisphaerae bacterium]|nr:serine/threonine protein kinase [Gemmatimonadaceae bacterium]